MTRTQTLLALCMLTGIVGCGGSGNSNQGSGSPTPTKTRTPVGGATATRTPVAAATATPTVLAIHPGGSIIAALRAAPAGATIVVAAGTYAPLVLTANDQLKDGISLLADPTGQLSGGPSQPVTISAPSGTVAAVQISGTTGLTLDGFTLDGGTEEALLILDSPQTSIRNCLISGSDGDGIFVELSDQALLFDNLVANNGRAGIRVWGSADLQAINNTVYNNQDNGIAVSSDPGPSNTPIPSGPVNVVNNIVNANAPTGIVVDATTTSYTGNFNLNTDGYGPDTPEGLDDIDANPLFIDPNGEDFHLANASPAVDAGDSSIDAGLLAILQVRTTQSDFTLDTGIVDLGYHYAAPPPTPTKAPKTPKPTPTHTPTP